MSRSKDRPVLFEVLNRGSAAKLTPSGKLRPTPAPALERRNKPAPRPIERPGFEADGGDAVPREPIIQFRNGRLRINLGWIGLSAAGVGSLLILLVAFQAGGRFAGGITSGDSRPDDELSRILAMTPDPSVLDSPDGRLSSGSRRIATPPLAALPTRTTKRGKSETSPPAASSFNRQKGMHYIIVQYFPKSKSTQARAAARFLTAGGVPCSVDESGRDIRVFAHESFRLDQPDKKAARSERERCESSIAKIKKLGKEYIQKGGYDFKGCAERRY